KSSCSSTAVMTFASSAQRGAAGGGGLGDPVSAAGTSASTALAPTTRRAPAALGVVVARWAAHSSSKIDAITKPRARPRSAGRSRALNTMLRSVTRTVPSRGAVERTRTSLTSCWASRQVTTTVAVALAAAAAAPTSASSGTLGRVRSTVFAPAGSACRQAAAASFAAATPSGVVATAMSKTMGAVTIGTSGHVGEDYIARSARRPSVIQRAGVDPGLDEREVGGRQLRLALRHGPATQSLVQARPGTVPGRDVLTHGSVCARLGGEGHAARRPRIVALASRAVDDQDLRIDLGEGRGRSARTARSCRTAGSLDAAGSRHATGPLDAAGPRRAAGSPAARSGGAAGPPEAACSGGAACSREAAGSSEAAAAGRDPSRPDAAAVAVGTSASDVAGAASAGALYSAAAR